MIHLFALSDWCLLLPWKSFLLRGTLVRLFHLSAQDCTMLALTPPPLPS